jgi:transposase-like protein
MPRKDETATPKKLVDKFIKRHLEGGESVEALAKEYKISRASGYAWLKKHRDALLSQTMREGMSPTAIEKSDKATLVAQVQALKLENAKLRNKVVSLMIKAGDL